MNVVEAMKSTGAAAGTKDEGVEKQERKRIAQAVKLSTNEQAEEQQQSKQLGNVPEDHNDHKE